MNSKAKKHKGKGLIADFFKRYSGAFFLALLFSLISTFLNALTPQIIRFAVDTVIGEQAYVLPEWLAAWLTSDSTRNLLMASAAIVASAGLSGAFNYLSRMRIAVTAESYSQYLRDRLFSHIQKLPFSWHSQNQTGDIIQRCTSDAAVIRNFLSNQLLEVFRIFFLIVLFTAIMFSMNVTISLVAVLFIPLVAFYSVIFFFQIAKRFRLADEAEGELSSAVQENLTGVRVVRAFGRERYEIKRFDEKNNRYANLWIRLGKLMSVYWSVGDFITGLQILTVICMGVLEATAGRLTLGEFLAFVSYNSMLIWPVRSLGRILSEMSKSGVSVDRLRYILDSEEERDDSAGKEPPMTGDIAFHSVSFQYTNDSETLRDISFTIPAGSTFAILGGTGSGKTTLMHLLDRLYELPPENGSITVGGVDISEIKLSHLRKNIGIVLQEPFLFSRTVEENIRAAAPGVSFDDVRDAACIACVDDSIASFTDGYGTIVGERGVTLSGGQKQRVAIARMLMQHAPIMIFDDSLSAVDTETDAKIRAALKKRLADATVILISHRITTLMQADKILVLENGRIAEIGTHEELLKMGGIYKSIYDLQMNSDDRMLLERI